jgi:hypothetical protein
VTAYRSTYQRISRRELHSPRSVAAITLAVLTAAACLWLMTEIVLHLLGRPGLLATPAEIAHTVAGAGAAPPALVGAIGVVVTLIGALLLFVALAPGRRSRHLLAVERAVTIVDSEVIASALARDVASAAGVAPDNARVTVTGRHVTVHLTPTSGIPVNRTAALTAVQLHLHALGLRRVLQPKVIVATQGRVGV